MSTRALNVTAAQRSFEWQADADPPAASGMPPRNLLPRDGEVHDHGRLYAEDEATALLTQLCEAVPFRPDELVIAGKRVVTSRLVAWYGDDGAKYGYSGATKVALPFTPTLRTVKERVERAAGCTFNACLLNLYPTGQEGMSWHSDDEPALGRSPIIASLSLGAARRFDFRHKRDREKVSVTLEHGQLLVMRGVTQHHWQHALPKTAKVHSVRVNLTFRTILLGRPERP